MSPLWTSAICLVAIVLYQATTPITVNIFSEVAIAADKVRIFKFLSNLTKVLEQGPIRVKIIGTFEEEGVTMDYYKMVNDIPILGSFSFSTYYDAFLCKFPKNFTISTKFETNFAIMRGKTTWTLHNTNKDGNDMVTKLKEQFTATCPWIFSHITETVAREEHRHTLESIKERMEAEGHG
ncbi:uncharacterized protein LOC117103138 [Anneissia japonica]|uniref:uncharacterized protein LOC117103138 n=1 Tax=Anneissia japonica TaxID=1529436 RepID=UPI0014256B2F|nr:uncharacterized protein LOC117103138 [Anneissia japonica]